MNERINQSDIEFLEQLLGGQPFLIFVDTCSCLFAFKERRKNVKYVLNYLLIMLFCFSVLLQLLLLRNALVSVYWRKCYG